MAVVMALAVIVAWAGIAMLLVAREADDISEDHDRVMAEINKERDDA